jgi:hypothetical protein
MTSAANMFRQFFCSNDKLNHSDIVTRSVTLITCQPGDAHSFVDDLRDQGVGGVSYFSLYVGGKRNGALRVSGVNKDGIPVSVILYLRKVELQRALDNNMEPGIRYANFDNFTRTPSKAAATQNVILPLLKKSDEPAVQALGNLHLVSEDHFADLVLGIQTAMGMSGVQETEPKQESKMRAPKKKALVAVKKLQSNNLRTRISNRLSVMNHAEELGVRLPIARHPAPKSQKDAAKERQRSRYAYGWIGQEAGSGFINLAPSILHYDWF